MSARRETDRAFARWLRRRWQSRGGSAVEALVVTGAVALAAAGAFQTFGSGTGDKAKCFGDQLLNGGGDCGAAPLDLPAPMAGAQPPGAGASAAGSPPKERALSSATGVGPAVGQADIGQAAQTRSATSREPAAQTRSATSGGQADAADSEPSVGSSAPPSLTDTEITAIENQLKKEGGEAGKSHVPSSLDLPPHTSAPGLTRDGNNALLNALLFTSKKDPKYAKQAAAILSGWAKSNGDFKGANGWLNAAWYVGEMARAAKMLKDSAAAQKIPGVKESIAAFTDWAKKVANNELLPKNAPPFGTDRQTVLNWEKPLRPNAPQLGTWWERSNVSNRTMTGLQATMHIALLAGDMTWFNQGVQAYKYLVQPRNDGTSFFLNKEGKNADWHRQDKPTWHHQAGIAAAVAISQMASHVKDPATGKPYDLWSLEDGILRKSGEMYAKEALDDQKAGRKVWYIPWYQGAVDHYGAGKMPNTKKLLDSHTTGWDAYMDTGWGFNKLL